MQAPDQAARIEALNPAESFIVQAPAGSGKTELLTGRFLTLLSTVRYPEEVVAITFTRKAATEMQLRILSALARAKAGIEPEAAHEKLNYQLAQKALARDKEFDWHLLENPQRLRLSTIDSLSAQITAQLPITAHFGEHFSVSEQAGELYDQAVGQLILSLREDLPWVPALERLMLYLDNRLDVLKQLLSNMLSRREMWLDIIVGIGSQENLKGWLESAVRTVVEEGLSRTLGQFPWEHEEVVHRLYQHSYQEPLVLDDNIDALSQWQRVASWLLTATGTVRKTVDKRQGFLPKTDEKIAMVQLLKDLQNHAGFIEQLNLVSVLPEPHYDDQTWQVTSDLLEVLKALAAYLRMVFKQQSSVDFNEIAMLALQSLGPEDSPSDIMLRLDYRVSHLLVDEYQDTALLQHRLFTAMTRGWQSGDGRTLFLVGDPMQSIYRFRQAEVSLFIRTIEEGLGGKSLRFIRLTANFRSQAGIIQWINQYFAQLFPAVSDPVNGAVAYSASDAIHPVLDQSVTIQLAEEEVSAQVSQLVSKIKAYRQNNPDDSVAILVRSRGHLSRILPALNAADLPYHGVDIEPLSARALIQDLLSLTYAIYQQDDLLSWMALLRSPLVGLSLAELLACRGALDELPLLEALKQCPHQALVRALPLFEAAFAKRYREPVAPLIRSVWLGLNGTACVTEASDLENAERFFACLSALNPDHHLPERQLLEKQLSKLYAERVPSTENPISVMTIHKAKGLEFDFVILPMLEQATRAEDKPLLLWQDLSHMGRHELMIAPQQGADRRPNALYDFLFVLQKDKAAKELVRLFYVAATRAKKALLLTGTLYRNPKEEFRAPPSGSLLGLLAPYLDLKSYLIPAVPAHEEVALWNPIKKVPLDYALNQPTPALFLPEVLEDLNHPAAPLQSDGAERMVGTIVHRYLELISFDITRWTPVRIEQCQPMIEKALLLAGVCLSHAKTVTQALLNTLADEKGCWILSAHESAKSEWALSTLQEGRLQTHIIDRSFIADGQRWIVDYKTSVPSAGETVEAFLDGQYKTYADQLNRYTRLLKAYDKGRYPIKAVLYFPLLAKGCQS